ncbi:MAG: hypothetical protein Q8R36_01545 [bacterium]|nr:hypothetical protein [bacterium]
MVNIFPDLLTFGLFAPFIIRIFLGLYFIIWGWSIVRKTEIEVTLFPKKIIGLVGIVAGTLVTLGLFTQIGALILSAFSLYFARHESNRLSYILLFGMALSLLFSGAGFLAFDFPL